MKNFICIGCKNTLIRKNKHYCNSCAICPYETEVYNLKDNDDIYTWDLYFDKYIFESDKKENRSSLYNNDGNSKHLITLNIFFDANSSKEDLLKFIDKMKKFIVFK